MGHMVEGTDGQNDKRKYTSPSHLQTAGDEDLHKYDIDRFFLREILGSKAAKLTIKLFLDEGRDAADHVRTLLRAGTRVCCTPISTSSS